MEWLRGACNSTDQEKALLAETEAYADVVVTDASGDEVPSLLQLQVAKAEIAQKYEVATGGQDEYQRWMGWIWRKVELLWFTCARMLLMHINGMQTIKRQLGLRTLCSEQIVKFLNFRASPVLSQKSPTLVQITVNGQQQWNILREWDAPTDVLSNKLPRGTWWRNGVRLINFSKRQYIVLIAMNNEMLSGLLLKINFQTKITLKLNNR